MGDVRRFGHDGDVVGWVGGEGDHVGVITGFEQAGLGRLRAQGERRAGGGGLDGGQRRQARLDHEAEFRAILPPAGGRRAAGAGDVGAQRDPHPAFVGEGDRRGVLAGDLEQLAVRVVRQARGGTVGEVLLDDEPGGYQHRAAFAHGIGRLLVEVGAMFDGAHARA
jgi:hypothetical protein